MKTIQRVSESKNWSFEMINKIDQPLTQLTKTKKVIPILIELEMDRETIQHKDNKGIQNIIMEFFENLYFMKLGNLKKKKYCRFIQTTKEETSILSSSITNKIEIVLKSFLIEKGHVSNGLTIEF